MRKRKRRQRAKMWPLPHDVHGEIDEYEGAMASKARMAVLSWTQSLTHLSTNSNAPVGSKGH